MKLPVPAPQLADLVGSGQISLERLLDLGIGPEIAGVYEHWDHLLQLTPPEGLTPEAWWAAIKLSRIGLERDLPLHDKHGEPFAVSITGNMQRKLHYLDREAAGAIQSSGMVDDDSTRKRYLMRSLIEEAMTSSQLDRKRKHTSELQSLMRISYAVFCLKKKKHNNKDTTEQ